MLVCYDSDIIMNVKMKFCDISQELTALNKNLDVIKMSTFGYFCMVCVKQIETGNTCFNAVYNGEL